MSDCSRCIDLESQILLLESQRDDYHRKACDIADQRDAALAKLAKVRRTLLKAGIWCVDCDCVRRFEELHAALSDEEPKP